MASIFKMEPRHRLPTTSSTAEHSGLRQGLHFPSAHVRIEIKMTVSGRVEAAVIFKLEQVGEKRKGKRCSSFPNNKTHSSFITPN